MRILKLSYRGRDASKVDAHARTRRTWLEPGVRFVITVCVPLFPVRVLLRTKQCAGGANKRYSILILPLGIEVSELASEFLKAVSILVMPASQRSS